MYKFKPILKSLVWGGNKIAAYKGISTTQSTIGESWELSGMAGSESEVAEGPDKGKRLPELIRRDRGELVGEKIYSRFGDHFPLLIKFIDAREDLSLQVHPNEEIARQRHHASGKSEMWYVVDAEAGAHIRSGFRTPLAPEKYAEAVKDGSILEMVADYRVEAGDLFYIPAGRIHTIGAGTLLVEIQQSSSITYRIFDYNRTGLDGRPRELHTEWAREALDFSVEEEYRTPYQPATNRAVPLIHCPHFTTNLFDLTTPQLLDLDWIDSFVVVICTEGSGTLTDHKGRTMTIKQGETVLVEASVKCLTMTPEQDKLKLITAWL